MLAAVGDLQKQGLKGMVIDLRGNPGGLLDKAVDIADDFLASGVIVSVRGRQPEMTRTYTAHKGQKLESLPIIVVVDEGSASASEILAAALHDNNRSLLVGGRTYGKGSVQNVIPLGDGETLKMTTAHYYRPNDEPIEYHQGIMPDIYLPMSREHELALRNQEREDKLRGRYRLGADFVEERAVRPRRSPHPARRPSAVRTEPKRQRGGRDAPRSRGGLPTPGRPEHPEVAARASRGAARGRRRRGEGGEVAAFRLLSDLAKRAERDVGRLVRVVRPRPRPF